MMTCMAHCDDLYDEMLIISEIVISPILTHALRCHGASVVNGIFDSFLYPASLWRPQGIFPGSHLPVSLAQISSNIISCHQISSEFLIAQEDVCIYPFSQHRYSQVFNTHSLALLLLYQGRMLKSHIH